MRWFMLFPGLLAVTAEARPAAATQNNADQIPAITTADVARYLKVLTPDSMQRPETPSPGVERTVRYIAAEFQQLSGKSWNHIRRYPLPGQRPVSPHSAVKLMHMVDRQNRQIISERGGWVRKQAILDFATSVSLSPEVGKQLLTTAEHNVFKNDFLFSKPLILLAGRHTMASVRQALDAFSDHAVLYAPSADTDSAVRHQIITEIYQAARPVIVVSRQDSSGFAADAAEAAQKYPATVLDDFMKYSVLSRSWAWAVSVNKERSSDFFHAVGIDLDRVLADPTPVVQALPSTAVMLFPRPVSDFEPITASNARLTIKGRDAALKNQVIVITAPVDDRSHVPVGTDSTQRVRSDNVQGLVQLLALANAFSQPGAQPRRSVVLAATSGRASHHAGANFFAHERVGSRRGRVVAALTLDMTGPLNGDTLIIDGLQDVEVMPSPTWVLSGHPELGVTVTPGATTVQLDTESSPFVTRGVPSLVFRSPATTSGDAGYRTSAATDPEQLARVARALFYISQSIANAPEPPQWTAATTRLRLLLDRER